MEKLSKHMKINRKIPDIVLVLVFMFGSMYTVASLRDIQGETWCITNRITNTFTMETAAFGILTGVLLWKYLKLRDVRLQIVSFIFGAVCGLTCVFGHILQYQNDIGNAKAWVCAFLMGLSLFPVPAWLYALFADYVRKQERMEKIRDEVREFALWKTVLFYWLVFFVSYLPAFFAYYPGLPVYDAVYQFKQIRDGFMTTHHPVIHMILLKAAYRFGLAIGSINLAMALLTLFQMAVLAFAFAYMMGFFRKMHFSRKLRIAIATGIVLFPIHAVYSVSITKDVLFAAFFVLYLVETLYFYESTEQAAYGPGRCAWYILLTVFMLLFRNNAVYAFVLGIPFLVWCMKGKRRKLLILSVLSLMIFFASDRGMKKAEGAFDNSAAKETFSLPLQQIGRVYAYREKSREGLKEVTTYIPEAQLLSYNPYIADGVKSGIDNERFRENLNHFIRMWFRIAFRYPGEYTEAFLSNTMGYWYLGDTMHARIYGEGGYLVVKYDPEQTFGMVSPHCYFKAARNFYDGLFLKNGYQKIPLISMVFRPACYFFLYFACLLFIFYKKAYRSLVTMIPVIAYFLTVLLGPAAMVRYIYCLICAVPVVVLWILRAQLIKRT